MPVQAFPRKSKLANALFGPVYACTDHGTATMVSFFDEKPQWCLKCSLDRAAQAELKRRNQKIEDMAEAIRRAVALSRS